MINPDLINDVRQWGYAKGILKDYEPHELFNIRKAQGKKTLEEVQELFMAIHKGSRVEARDAIGDVLVTLIMQADLWDTNVNSCLALAYAEISKRTGKMVDGQFVKDK